jgi:hypothetical protein
MTTVVNALLVRYAGGHVYVDRSDGHVRREQYVEMAGVRDRDHAIALGREVLALSASSRTTDARQGDVRSIDQLPGVGYRLADTIDGELLAGITLTLSGEEVTIVHEVNDSLKTRQDAMARRLARAASGVTGEYAAPVINRQDTGTGVDTTPPAFSLSQVQLSFSPAWRVPRPFHLSWLEVVLTNPLTSATRVAVTIDSRPTTSVTVDAGDDRAVGVIDLSLATGSQVIMICPLAGSGVAGLTATLRGAMI